jgi:methylglutaconyl-CoA hydratase
VLSPKASHFEAAIHIVTFVCFTHPVITPKAMKLITYEVHERIGTITLNRPEKRNALSPSLVIELDQAFDLAERDENVKVIILQANGETFCAGADLAYLQELQQFSYEQNLEDSMRLKSLYEKIFRLKKIVIAQVQGHALAGGCGLATVCDIVFSVPEAKFGYTEVKIGFIPALVMVFLVRKIGEQRARFMLLSGELISAEVAQQYGLVHQLCPTDDLKSVVRAFAAKIVRQASAQSLELTKSLLAQIQSRSLEDGLALAASANAHARATDDCKKGIAAFLSKQELTW